MGNSQKQHQRGFNRVESLKTSEKGQSNHNSIKPAAASQQNPIPDPEVHVMPKRRRLTAEYKLGILEAFDACMEPGEKGALLRREGLYSSNIIRWRQLRDTGMLTALSPKKRGRKKAQPDPLRQRVAELEREKLRLGSELKQARLIIEVQKKISEIVGVELVAVEKRALQ